jgi:Lipopolysaccharide assembly protein A domain
VWRKLILVLVVLPLAVVLIALAVVNRKPALLVLDPLGGTEPGLSLEAPLFLLLLGAFAFGLVVGGIATWIGQGKWRRLARKETRQARDWRRQADRLEKELESTDRGPPRAQLPAE